MKRLAFVAVSLATALTSVPPAMAFPTIVAPKIDSPQAQRVDYHGGHGGYYHGGYYHHHGNAGWGWALGGLAAGAIVGGLLAQPNYYAPDHYYDPGYYGPSYYAPRYYRRAYYGGNAHTRWCYARYRSYRSYDNTFQPYYGPRQACVSPYY